jgi:GT2 family glycosyltransferase
MSTSKNKPRVTVVMITRDRREEALACVERHLSLAMQPQVIVVDNGSVDGTVSAVRTRFPSVRVVEMGRNAGSAGRNAGVARARTPYVAFADDDSWWEDSALRTAVEYLDFHPLAALTAARVCLEPHGDDDPGCLAMDQSPLGDDDGARRVLGFMARSTVVRKDAFVFAGGFDERYVVDGEEMPLALELASRGWKLAYLPHAVVHYAPSSRGRDPRARSVRSIRNDLWTAWSRRRGWGVVRGTVSAMRRGEPSARLRAFWAALRHGAWIIDERRPVSAEVEAQFRLVESNDPTGVSAGSTEMQSEARAGG